MAQSCRLRTVRIDLSVAIRDDNLGRYHVQKFLLYSRELFESIRGDSEILQYLDLFRMICESRYGVGDGFCRCDGGELTLEYNLVSETYESRRRAQTVQCLDDDCIFRKNLKHNIVSRYKLDAMSCDMDRTTSFNPEGISSSSQVHVINRCGSGSSDLPSFANNTSIGSMVVSGLLLVLVGLIVILPSIGLYREPPEKHSSTQRP